MDDEIGEIPIPANDTVCWVIIVTLKFKVLPAPICTVLNWSSFKPTYWDKDMTALNPLMFYSSLKAQKEDYSKNLCNVTRDKNEVELGLIKSIFSDPCSPISITGIHRLCFILSTSKRLIHLGLLLRHPNSLIIIFQSELLIKWLLNIIIELIKFPNILWRLNFKLHKIILNLIAAVFKPRQFPLLLIVLDYSFSG